MLRRLRGRADVSGDVDEMAIEQQRMQSQHQLSLTELLASNDLRRPLIVGIVIMVAQQLSGEIVMRVVINCAEYACLYVID